MGTGTTMPTINLEYIYRKLRRALVEKKPATKPTDTNRTDKKKSHLID